ncbi:sarcosine oxidase subunit alpha family protein [Profundibacterium mesophilum]|uniref:Sarcosine oxidase alpha subunit n=1 Tax=Profundibacterium mesophilum KAUST100406-0324 TaxID=1037889 RepID=A0A921NQT6_9RHOB|nr:sarcosine oxidase subunit alpha family protein [Profundibacterium mesophilum]KAF0676702.1 putative sarcosine oxidase alpha subunit [Profundibacterium mesophilum KAUST100406-0324]
MSSRLSTGGRLIDRDRRVAFSFNGRALEGYEGDTLASALLAADQMLMGRSFKYHRPRGVVASGPEEPNALMGIGEGRRFEPNVKASVAPLSDGLQAISQNHWPSLEHDIGAVNAALSPFLPAGFYYKMFKQPRAFWKHVYEPFIRRSAGLGRPPEGVDADRYEHFNVTVDVVVIGGGVAGIEAARAAAARGAQVLLIEQRAHWGGRAPVDGGTIDDMAPADWVERQIAALAALPNVHLRLRCMGAGIYDHGYCLAQETCMPGPNAPQEGAPRHRLWRIRARRIITATGAIERPLAFAGNDVPGVMLASAMRDYLVDHAVAAGDRSVIITNNDDAYRSALALHRAGLTVCAILDLRGAADGALPQEARAAGLRVITGRGIAGIRGGKRVTGVAVCGAEGSGAVLEEIACDAVGMSGGWSPVVHLWSHCGGKLAWDAERGMFLPDPDRAPTGADGTAFVRCAGAAGGHFALGALFADAFEAGCAAATDTGAEDTGAGDTGPKETGAEETASRGHSAPEEMLQPVWMVPQAAGPELRAKIFLDFQNDVKVSDVQLAAREGFESVEHAKRYTTLGMATDQGKLSNINGLAILAQARGAAIPDVGTTTFRPPYTPISMGAVAGEARGALFQPVRRTPMHDWHDAHGADWEPVGHWRRPYCYLHDGERRAAAVSREVTAVRTAAGILDASTLGKIVVRGPDAARFLDMIYTNMMSTLKPGRCRYGLICDENGFLIDDGVVARLGEDSFLCHTTTGGAERIHAHMEEWLQTEWWDWKVYCLNQTEQFAQIAVAGPKAREILERLGGMALDAETLPFMGWMEGTLGGIAARVFRISFSGELSYEIAVPAGQGPALWNKLVAAGGEAGITPYGTEALHVLRAEKGFIMIGDETDGTVIPQDLGLDWAVSKKKEDFIGKRALSRSHMSDPGRWKLVGLETLSGEVLPDGAYAIDDGHDAAGQKAVQGRVTSSYRSATLGRGIALGLLRHGPERMGEIVEFTQISGPPIAARICDPVFYDKEGAKQDV